MNMASRQIASIKRAQANTFGAQSTSDTPNEIAFTIETQKVSSAEILHETLQRPLTGLSFEIETVFLDDRSPRFFLLTLAGASFDDLPGSPFDIAYHLEEALDGASVEPDLETDFVDWNGASSDKGFGAASAAKSLCFVSPEPNPDASDLGWALRMIKVDEARAKYKVTGKGVKIAHIDTGIASHVDTASINIDAGLNLIEKIPGAWDPLTKDGIGHNPGHGTATASVIVSNGGLTPTSTSGPGRVSGVAPDAELFPIRAIKTVVRFRQSKVARAIDKARKAGAHVITMSLGGIWSGALRRALHRAVHSNIIVMAAAGNCVREVVYPARYNDCIAVAGMNEDKEPWKGTSRGSEVDFCAPGQFVWCARRNEPSADSHSIGPGQGTSFAVALSAGVAALWLERHGRDSLIKSLTKGETLQEKFKEQVALTARKAPKIPKSLGAGIINAVSLMELKSSKSFAASGARTVGGNVVEQDALAMLTAAGDKTFGAASTKRAKIDQFDLEGVAGEVIWRVLLEARGRSLRGRAPELPPMSERLQAMCSENENLSVWIP